MPLNGGGTASRVPGTTAIPNSTIKSAEYDASTDDIYAIFNTPRPIVYGGTNGTSAVEGGDNLSTKGADIPSATTTDIGASTGRFVHITGTTTITGLGTKTAGVVRFVVFDGILTLTHNATSLILPGATSITTAAGDTAIFISEGSGNWRCVDYVRATGLPIIPASPLQVRGQLYGLTLSNNATDAVNDIDIAVGSASMALTPFTVMTLSSALTKRLDSNWVVGTNQGGLDTGSIANVTYHIYLIRRSDTGVVDACFSASASAPTTGGSIPAAYDQYRRVGSILRISAAIVLFIQNGNIFNIVPQDDVAATNPGTSAVTRTLSTPLGIKTIAFGNVALAGPNNGTNYVAYLSSLDLPDTAPSSSNAQVGFTSASAANRQTGHFQVPTNTSSQIRSRLGTSDASTGMTIITRGWFDTAL